MVSTRPMAPLTSKPLTKDFAFSRLLRAFLFAFVVSALLVSLVIVLVSFIWDEFVAGALNRPPYDTRLVIIGPLMLFVTLIVTKVFWDMAKVKEPQRVSEPGQAPWSEPTTHAAAEARARYDPNPGVSEKTIRTGPTGPSGYGAPSGGWDKPKLP
jgi:hypothetical protein